MMGKIMEKMGKSALNERSMQEIHPLTSYPGGLGAPTFLVENTGSKTMGPRKMTSDSIPENELEKKTGPDKSASFFNLTTEFCRKLNFDSM